jgi:hypothetical protein
MPCAGLFEVELAARKHLLNIRAPNGDVSRICSVIFSCRLQCTVRLDDTANSPPDEGGETSGDGIVKIAYEAPSAAEVYHAH